MVADVADVGLQPCVNALQVLLEALGVGKQLGANMAGLLGTLFRLLGHLRQRCLVRFRLLVHLLAQMLLDDMLSQLLEILEGAVALPLFAPLAQEQHLLGPLPPVLILCRPPSGPAAVDGLHVSPDLLVSPRELDAAQAAQGDLGVHGGVRGGPRRPPRGLGGQAGGGGLCVLLLAKCLHFVYIYRLSRAGNSKAWLPNWAEGRNPDKSKDFFLISKKKTFEIVCH